MFRLFVELLSSSSSMAPMLTAMVTYQLPRPSVTLDGVFCRVYTPSLSLRCGSDFIPVRGCGSLLIVGAPRCGAGLIRFDGGWRRGRRGCIPAFGGDCSLEASDDGGHEQEDSTENATSVWKSWQMYAGELREKVSKLGRAGLLAYGLFNGIIYTTFFFIAFLAFEKSTGQNPANNLKGCLGGMVTLWTGNNFTRPLRVAGAAAMAPFMDKVLKKTQKVLKFEDEASAFLFLVILLFALCGASVGLLILSRMGR